MEPVPRVVDCGYARQKKEGYQEAPEIKDSCRQNDETQEEAGYKKANFQ